MLLTKEDITWLEPGFAKPQRTMAEDARVYEVWADMTGTEWAKRNGFPFALVAFMNGIEAHVLVERLYEINGAAVTYGVRFYRNM